MDEGDAASVNTSRPSCLPGCVSTGRNAGRRRLSPARWCAADHGRLPRENLPRESLPRESPPREKSWADAAAPPPPDTVTAPVRANGSNAADQVANPARRPTTTTPPARPVPSPPRRLRRPLGPVQRAAFLTAAVHAARARVRSTRNGARLTWAWTRLACTQLRPEPGERLTDWLARCLQQLGDLVFAGEDAEAAWHAWNVERRCAGLGRLYRDQRFDALAACPRCQRISTLAGRSVCQQCSAADRLVRT
jgi:hypothetical protein